MSDPAADNDILAAEYVVGVLPPDQARALEALALREPELARSIDDWKVRLAPLAELVQPVEPPATLWRRLELAIGVETAAVVPLRPAAPRRRLWPAATLAGMAIAAGVTLFVVRQAPEPIGKVATLLPAGAPAPAFLVRVDPGGHATVLAVAGAQPPSGRSFELWVLREGAATPVSLGILPVGGQRQFPLDVPAGTKLLVSQEPRGGSPTGLPTGPVVFSGTLDGV